MTGPLLGMALVLVTLGGLLSALTLYRRLGVPHPELLRKLLHVGMGLTTLLFPVLFDKAWPVMVLGALSVSLLVGMRLISGLKANVGQVVGGVSRFSLGEIYFPVAVGVLWLLYLYGSTDSPERRLLLYIIPLLLLTISDALAALVGVTYGGNKYVTSDGFKSHEGSIAFFLSAFLCVHIPLLLMGDRGRPETLLIAVLLALLATMFEAVAWSGLDNLALPLISYLLLVLYWDLPVSELVIRLAATVVLFTFALALSRLTALRGSAVLGATLVGYVCWALGGLPWLVPPVMLYVGYVLLSCRNPENDTKHHNVHAVACVGSAGLVWLFLSRIQGRPEWLYPFTVAFAAHMGIIALAQIRYERPQTRPPLSIALCAVGGWLLLMTPYVLIQKATTQSLWETAVALPAVALAVTAFAILQPGMNACPLDVPRWLRQAACAAVASVLAVLPLLLFDAPEAPMNLTSILPEFARSHPDVAALLDPYGGRTRITTFADLDRLSAQAAALLLEKKLRPGDVVLVLHPMSAELYVALMALFRLGMVVMALDPSAGLEHIRRCCELQPPRGLIASSKAHLLRLLSPALRRIPITFSIGWFVPFSTRWSRFQHLRPHTQIADMKDDEPALLTFTSGSTGQPKGAVRSHGFLLAQRAALAHSLALTPGDIDLATLPIVLLANLASRVTSLVPDADLRRPGFIDPVPVVRQIQEHDATSSVASPAFFERLARYCLERKITLTSVRKLFTGGAPVFPRLLEQMQQMAPNADVVALYGSTEAEPIAHLSRREIDDADNRALLGGRGLLTGPPVPEVTLRILGEEWGKPVGPFTREQFASRCCAANQPGEIVVTGGHVLKGYLNGVGDHETKFRVDGEIWHRTGDAGYLDERGRLWLLGRCVARIDDSDGQLYPFAAETAVYQDPHVKRAAVVAHNGKRLLVLEWYDPTRPGDAEAIRRSLNWANIAEVRVWPRVPVDNRHNAKIDYPALLKQLRSGG